MNQEWTQLQHRLTTTSATFLSMGLQLDPLVAEQRDVWSQWSPKDVVAHLIGWDHEAARRFQLFMAGPTEDLTYNVDEFNSHSVAARQHLSWDQVIEELRLGQMELRAVIEAVKPDNLAMESRFYEWLEALSRHYEEHTAQFASLKR